MSGPVNFSRDNAGSERNPFSVLVADDESGYREGIEEYLRRRGYRTLVAEDGAQALRIVRREVVHLSVLDVHMPTLGGLEVLRVLRREGWIVPVILMSGDASPDLERRAIEAGGYHLVRKPIVFDDFRRRIEQLFDAFYR